MPNTRCYTLVGNGRVARHMKFYLQSQNIRLHQWARSKNTPAELQHALDTCDTVLLLIKDSEIQNFINEHPALSQKTLVHFSGALSLSNTVGLHPLMTFSDQLYPLDFYPKIPFVSESGNTSFQEVFPQLKNPSTAINPKQKALYHSLCVMGGNFTTILWSKVLETFKSEFGIDAEMVFPYIDKITENVKHNHKAALTGPLARRDIQTLQKNLEALKDDSFSNVYRSFIEATQPDLLKEMSNDNP